MDDFCQYKLFKRPRPNLMIPPPFLKSGENDAWAKKKTPTLQLRASDPAKILFLCDALKDENSLELELTINKYILEETKCSCVFLISLCLIKNVAVIRIIDNEILKAFIHLPSNDDLIQTIINSKMGLQFPFHSFNTHVKNVVLSIVPDARGEVFSFPIYHLDPKDHIMDPDFIICMMNCKGQIAFVSQLVHEMFRFSLPILLNTIKAEEEARLKIRTQALLACARSFFADLKDLSSLNKDIVEKVMVLTESQEGFLYFLNRQKNCLELCPVDEDVPALLTLPRDKGVAGFVVSTGHLLNIEDAYSNKLFNKSWDEDTGSRTKNILCFPIRDEKRILGIVHLSNKRYGDYNIYDEELVSIFGLYAGIAISHSKHFKTVHESLIRHQTSNKLLLKTLQFRPGDIKHLLYAQKPSYPKFGEFSFVPRKVPLHHASLLMLKIFEDLNFMSMFKIDRNTLCRFICAVQHGYKNSQYHNWLHAFCSTYFAYAAIVNFGLIVNNILSNLEAMILLISMMCHDIDHVPNKILNVENDKLSSLYTSNGSILEKHHITQTFCILNLEGCNLLENLSLEDYANCLEMIKTDILATDIQTHFKMFKKQEIILTNCPEKSKDFKSLFRSLMVTCSDFSDQTQNWETVIYVAAKIYLESFPNPKLEPPTVPGMPEHECIDLSYFPRMQIIFLDQVCFPIYRTLHVLFNGAKIFIDAIETNMKLWAEATQYFIDVDGTVLDVLSSTELESLPSRLKQMGEEEEAEEEEKADAGSTGSMV